MSTCWVILLVMFFFERNLFFTKINPVHMCLDSSFNHFMLKVWKEESSSPKILYTCLYPRDYAWNTCHSGKLPCALAMHCTPSPLYLMPHFQCENEQASIRVCRSCVVRWPHTMPVNMDRGPKSCQNDHELRATDTKALCPKSKFMHGQCAQLNSSAGLGHL